MSHVPLIGGSLIASSEYQEYLARLGAQRRATRGSDAAHQLRTFDSEIDPDKDGGRGQEETASDDDEPPAPESRDDGDPGPGQGLSIRA